jgi:hypothetical protein
MKPLNRPMFRYGGPIKEGIMNGMKDNRQAINTVGSPLAPKDESGRGGYAIPLLGLGAAAMRFLPAAYRGFKAARAYTPMSQNLGTMGRLKDIFTPKGGLKITGGKAGEGAGFRVGSFLRQNPITTASLLPQAGAGVYSVGKSAVEAAPGLAKGYVDMLIPGESVFKKDDPKKIETEGGPPGGGDPNMVAKPKQKVVNQEELEKMNKDRIQKTKERYYKLMGIDKMNKDAVYDSLIDASKIISEEGADLKGAVKSGTLQNRIIQAISGQLDKSAALKRQIDAAVLKGEIEKDIKASDPTAKLNAERIEKQIAIYDKQLKGGDLRDIAQIYLKEGIPLKGQRLFTEATRKGIDTKGILPTEAVDEFLQKNPTLSEAEFVNIYQDQLVEAGKDKLPAGDYVVGGRIVTIGADGKAKTFVF